MFKSLILLVLGALSILPCDAQAIASRRYAEKTPTQYKFGPFTTTSPYNMSPNASSTVNANQLNPSNLISSNNNCASTGNFTVLEQTSPAATFSVSGNVCTVTTGSSGGVYILGDSNSSFAAPDIFITTQMNTVGAFEFGPVLSNGTGSTYLMADLFNSTSCNLVLFTGGSYHNLSLNSCTAPGANGYVGLSLVGSDACMWISTNGTTWTNTGCASTSGVYNFQTDGNLTGFKAGVRLTATSTTWKFNNIVSGGFGGTAVRDISLVTYPDGRPYMIGSVAYFTATTLDPTGAFIDGVYSYDVIGGTITPIGAILNDRSGTIETDVASHLIYDPFNAIYRYMVGSWGTGGSVVTLYGSWNQATTDVLTNGVHVITANTSTSTFNGGANTWDAHFACVTWNYSANTCSKWEAAYWDNVHDDQALSSSTSDPSANSWTTVGTSNAGLQLEEGARVYRSATGSTGVTYTFGFAGDSKTDVRNTNVFNNSMANIGSLNAPYPAGAKNSSHPQIFSYGNNEYYITFNDALWGTTIGTMGVWTVSSAPKYNAPTNWPTFVTGGSKFDGSTNESSTTLTTDAAGNTISVTSGDLIVAACRGGNASETSVAVTDSLGDTFTAVAAGVNTHTGGFTNGYYSFTTHTGTATFTCTLGTSSQFVGLTIQQFHPGFLTTTDSANQFSNQATVSILYTSSSLTTAAKGLIIICGDFQGNAGALQPGLIGPYTAAFGAGFTEGGATCEGTTTAAAQSSITGNMASGTGQANWGGLIFSFK